MGILSPISQSDRVEALVSYSPCITSDGRLTEGSAQNYLCLDSGLLFNAAGTRGNERGFYQDEYVLHSESVEAEFFHFDQGKPVGLYDNILAFMKDGAPIGASGRALDIGCGKGLLLDRFKRHFGAWKLHAVEPSKNATSFFAKIMPELSVFEGPFENSPFAKETFDFVMANGVLEHVPDPLSFLRAFRACIAHSGFGFIGVPNFATNPADLLTFDHLSRLTPNVIRQLFTLAGLEVVSEVAPTTRVPMWFILKRCEPTSKAPPIDIAGERAIAIAARKYVEGSFDACRKAKEASLRDGKPIAFFGSGTVAFAATAHTPLKLSDVSCIYEDNASLWGTERLGISVKPSSELSTAGSVHLVVSANPCYYNTIARRIADLANKDATVYFAHGEGK